MAAPEDTEGQPKLWRQRVALVLMLGVVVAVVVGFELGERNRSDSVDATTRPIAEAICAAAGSADGGDVDTARRGFAAIQQPLEEIARARAEADEAGAAKVRQTRAVVEALLGGTPDAATVSDALGRLRTAVAPGSCP